MDISTLGTGIAVYVAVIFALLGLVMGSFFLCAVDRTLAGISFVKGRSHCDGCGKELTGVDLIPVFGWLVHKGRSRCCGVKLSAFYPASELACAIVFVALFLKFGLTFQLVQWLVLACILFLVALFDLKAYVIPNKLVLAGIIWWVISSAGLAFLQVNWESALIDALWHIPYALIVPIVMLLVSLILERLLKKEALGGGDIKFFFMVGLYFSWQTCILGLLFSCIFGIIFALVGAKAKDDEQGRLIPFGPFISLAFFVCMLCGNEIVQAYLGLF